MKYSIILSKIPLKLCVLLIAFSLITISCGDDPASADGDPPEFPSFENTEPDLKYFEENNPQKKNANFTTDNFYAAKNYAITLNGFITLGQVYSGFFYEADREDADFRDGSWVWEYNYSVQGQTADITLIATEAGNKTAWKMIWSYDDGQGNSVEDYRVVEGSVENDGNYGNWIFNALDTESEEEIPAIVTDWTQSSEEEMEISSDIYDESEIVLTFDYKQDQNEHTLSLSGEDIQNNILIFWDTDSETGFYQLGDDESERNCWDSDFEDVEC